MNLSREKSPTSKTEKTQCCYYYILPVPQKIKKQSRKTLAPWKIFPTEAFALLPDSPKTQIHADIAFDGEQIWFAYNLPNEEAKFDIYLASIDCNGELAWGPQQILEFENVNQTTPRIAVSGNNILVAGQGDNSSSENNLSIQLHIQDQDGNLIDERDWAPIVDGEAVGNHWLPSVTGTDTGFWIAAAASNGPHFRTLVQALDQSGQPISPPTLGRRRFHAVYPNIDVQNEQYVVGWDDQENVYWTTGTADGQNLDVQSQENAAFARVLWDDSNIRVFSSQISPPEILLDGEAISDLERTHFPNAAIGEKIPFYMHTIAFKKVFKMTYYMDKFKMIPSFPSINFWSLIRLQRLIVQP